MMNLTQKTILGIFFSPSSVGRQKYQVLSNRVKGLIQLKKTFPKVLFNGEYFPFHLEEGLVQVMYEPF